MTLRGWLARAESDMSAGPHPDRARRDAETLLLHSIGKNRAWLLAHLDDDAGEGALAGYENLVRRRVAGEPIQYIIGNTEFYGLPFRVTSDVLIPRPETEHLVERAIALAAGFASPRIADVGTGSGAIAVALAHDLRSAQITAIDISKAALDIARENAERNSAASRITFTEGNLLQAVAHERFNLVVSNPPYVPSADRDSLSVEVRDYEPARALFASNDGLDIYRRLIPEAYAALLPAGFIVLEIGYGQSEAVRALLADAGFVQVEFTSDLQGIPRVATAQRPL